ncbi:MAG: hypothetical protein R3B49_05875 [Phycisphaerales bacterium]
MQFDFVDDDDAGERQGLVHDGPAPRPRGVGLFCGGSSGSIVHAAVESAPKELGPGKVIVCVLLRQRRAVHLEVPRRRVDARPRVPRRRARARARRGPKLAGHSGSVITANPGATVGEVVALMKTHG